MLGIKWAEKSTSKLAAVHQMKHQLAESSLLRALYQGEQGEWAQRRAAAVCLQKSTSMTCGNVSPGPCACVRRAEVATTCLPLCSFSLKLPTGRPNVASRKPTTRRASKKSVGRSTKSAKRRSKPATNRTMNEILIDLGRQSLQEGVQSVLEDLGVGSSVKVELALTKPRRNGKAKAKKQPSRRRLSRQ
jgi:hypothetical protein